MDKIIYTSIDRLLYFIEAKGLSIREFSKAVGISHSLLPKTKSLGTDKLEKIFSTYPELNPIWVLTGRGEMIEKNFKENVRAKMSGQNVRTKEQNVRAKRPDKDFSMASDGTAPAAPHLTGDFAAADSEPVDEKVYNALLAAKDRTIAAKDEIIATKDAQIADLRQSMADMRKGTEDLRRSIDNLEDAIETLQRASKGAPVVRDAGGAAAHRK